MSLHGARRVAVLVTLALACFSAPARADNPGELTAKVVHVNATRIVIAVGVEKGVKPGDEGTVWYEIVVGNGKRKVTLGQVRVIRVGSDTTEVSVVRSRGAIQPGYFVTLTGTTCGGKLIVRTEPPKAKIEVDGKAVESPTPTSVDTLCSGTHKIVLTLPQHERIEREIEVREGSPTELTVSITRNTADIEVLSVPDGADVFIDGQRAGVSPLTLNNVGWGEHRLRVEKPGFATQERSVTIERPRVEFAFALPPDVCVGDLMVTSDPPRAHIQLDGRDANEQTPKVFSDVACGPRQLKLSLPGYPDVEETVEVKHRLAARVNLTFPKQSSMLRVNASPQGADVYVNGLYAGSAPFVRSTEPGTYRVRVEKSGYMPEERAITVARAGVSEHTFMLRETEPDRPEKATLLLSTFGYEAIGGLQAVLTLGILTSQYAIEVDGNVVLDWRIRSADERVSLEPGQYKFRILFRHGIAREAVVAYEGSVVVGSHNPNEIKVNFLANTVTINGETDWFKKNIR